MNILIVCNPNSGRGDGLFFAKRLKKRFEKIAECAVEIFLSESVEKMREFFANIKIERPNYFNSIIILGGDGTFSLAVDALLKIELHVPVAIFPLGTVNDFAKQTHMSRCVRKCVKTIVAGKTKKCDVAFVNGEYVVNVACGGYFTHGANTYSRVAKKIFGKLAYFGKAAFNVFNMHAQKMRFTVDNETFETDTIMYLVMNSASAGGFRHIGANARIDDGLFDLCVIKKARLGRLARTAIKILGGRHIPDKCIEYRQGKHFKIELVGDKPNPNFLKSDFDGNVGDSLPLEIEVDNKKLEIYFGD